MLDQLSGVPMLHAAAGRQIRAGAPPTAAGPAWRHAAPVSLHPALSCVHATLFAGHDPRCCDDETGKRRGHARLPVCGSLQSPVRGALQAGSRVAIKLPAQLQLVWWRAPPTAPAAGAEGVHACHTCRRWPAKSIAVTGQGRGSACALAWFLQSRESSPLRNGPTSTSRRAGRRA